MRSLRDCIQVRPMCDISETALRATQKDRNHRTASFESACEAPWKSLCGTRHYSTRKSYCGGCITAAANKTRTDIRRLEDFIAGQNTNPRTSSWRLHRRTRNYPHAPRGSLETALRHKTLTGDRSAPQADSTRPRLVRGERAEKVVAGASPHAVAAPVVLPRPRRVDDWARSGARRRRRRH